MKRFKNRIEAEETSESDVCDLLPMLSERRRTVAGELSGGQQQMLAFAIALLGSPGYLLLGELLAKNFDVCKSLSIPAIPIEHKIASAIKIADQVMIINSGRLVFDGTKTEARSINLRDYF